LTAKGEKENRLSSHSYIYEATKISFPRNLNNKIGRRRFDADCVREKGKKREILRALCFALSARQKGDHRRLLLLSRKKEKKKKDRLLLSPVFMKKDLSWGWRKGKKNRISPLHHRKRKKGKETS